MTHYKGDIVAGSLLVSESRKIADLLIQGYAPDKIPDKILEDNLLQKRSPVTAKRQARLILNRLSGLDREFWYLTRDGSHDQAAQILLCSTLKHTRLLGDFIRLVIQPKIKAFQKETVLQDWNDFFEQCRAHERAGLQHCILFFMVARCRYGHSARKIPGGTGRP
ncbi:MAG: DUF1819 family protein [Thermodesulfobacteriota bacterium]